MSNKTNTKQPFLAKYASELWTGFTENFYKIFSGFVVFLLGLSAAFLAGRFLDHNYPTPVRPDDIFLDNIEEMKAFVLVAEITSTSVSLFIIHKALSKRLKPLGEYFFKIGTLYILRSISIVVTPLAQIQDPTTNGSNPVLAAIFYKGMFFSGHTALAFLIFFLERDNKNLRFAKLIVAVTTAASVVLSHSHYSIDVIGGFLAAYFVASLKMPQVLKKLPAFSKA